MSDTHSPNSAPAGSVARLDPAPTLVLVHGAWHGKAGWDPLLPYLAEAGVPVAVVQLPGVGRAPGGHDLAGHVRFLRSELAALPGPLVVCAHSYGGAVLTEAAADSSNVVGLIYLAAFQLDVGESCADVNTPAPESERQGLRAVVDGDYLRVPPSAAPGMFYGDCSAARIRTALAELTPEHVRTVTVPVGAAAWRRIPSTYIVCARDAAISPEAQRALARRAGRVHTLDSAHSPMLSVPGELAALLVDEVRRFDRAS
ncbi:alpha/beta hydrolase [Embleya sp. NBC_00888]|uniref:alpha/beta fold hydrolase n=1 Tax=Embleya sp. NBC_00888 TaxID=2975960 RepID=UPI003865B2FB|nr:alpha/beta hydrolase [Embleya sp. NBC_00888]